MLRRHKNDPLPLIPFFFLLCIITPALVLAGCQDRELPLNPGFPDNGEVVLERVESEETTFRVVRLIDNLEHPWGMTWLPGGSMLITERPGRLNLVNESGITRLTGLPEIQARNQGGLLDVALHPDYDNNGWVYFTYSTPADGGTATSLARARIGDQELNDLEVLYNQQPGHSPGRHYGSRIVFPGDGTILFTIGDRGQRSPSQDLADPTGSTIRLNLDGSVPDDNPFVNQEGVAPEIYSYGHRNAQGMVIDPVTGLIWQHEHGPRGGDELNIIRPGENYGWPEATYGVEYASRRSIGVEPHEHPESVNPVIHWTPSIAPSGLALYRGDKFPGWEGNLFVGALAHQHIRRVVLDGETVTHQEELLRDDLGRIRDVRTGPDGLIYILTDQSNASLYRIEPVD